MKSNKGPHLMPRSLMPFKNSMVSFSPKTHKTTQKLANHKKWPSFHDRGKKLHHRIAPSRLSQAKVQRHEEMWPSKITRPREMIPCKVYNIEALLDGGKFLWTWSKVLTMPWRNCQTKNLTFFGILIFQSEEKMGNWKGGTHSTPKERTTRKFFRRSKV